MELRNARVLVAGATGALGREITERLVEAGARVVPGGRDEQVLETLAKRCETDPVRFDVVDTDACAAAVRDAADQLGGLDALVVTVGVAGFGRALDTPAEVTEELFAVDTLGPIALVRAAAERLAEGGTVVVLSAILADLPTAQMADYSAAKAALSTWLDVLRREERRRLRVIDVRPPHLDTGLDTRAIGEEPPRLPAPMAAGKVVDAILQAMEDDAREVAYDMKERRLTVQ